MPRVIQPGGGGGEMRVRYTARRKRGLVAASKRMQAEGMTLGRYRRPPRQNYVLPHPAEKLIQNPLKKNEAATPSPRRLSPNPVVLRLNVMLSVLATGRSVRFRPPGRKM
jgi:hypothetical protein